MVTARAVPLSNPRHLAHAAWNRRALPPWNVPRPWNIIPPDTIRGTCRVVEFLGCSGIFGSRPCSGIFAAQLPPFARVAPLTFAVRVILDSLHRAFAVTIALVQTIFQIAHAVVLLILRECQLRTIFLTVGQQDGLGCLADIGHQRIHVARGRCVFHGTPDARCQAQHDQHDQQFQVHCG